MRQMNKHELEKKNLAILKEWEKVRTEHIKNEMSIRSKVKKFERHKELINRELNEELDKQKHLFSKESMKNKAGIAHLSQTKQKLDAANAQKIENLKTEKERTLNFIIEENDELEGEILKMNHNMLEMLDSVETEHKKAIQMLVHSYESSLKNMKSEITKTSSKLKENGGYFKKIIED